VVIQGRKDSQDSQVLRVIEGQPELVEHLVHADPSETSDLQDSLAVMVLRVKLGLLVFLEPRDSLVEMDRKDLLVLWANKATLDSPV